ncbi:hypothetical protein FFF34_007715 [Inquilinus sp. KBS0705]|nr:hypothetical protein FFF34_007715 [Inquilinus sp. KBS0705]
MVGADNALSTLTDATSKGGRIVFPHYNNADLPIGMLMGTCSATVSELCIGGGSGLSNATTMLSFYTAANNSTAVGTSRMTIDKNGNVGIGTVNPDQRLTVNGTIHSSEVKVDINIPVPDYVFSSVYPLKSLAEVKKYVDRYHHLPEIPSAEQIGKDGLDQGAMQMNSKVPLLPWLRGLPLR